MKYPDVKLPDGVIRRNTTLYSIGGWFADGANLSDGATAFGGFFRLDEEDHTFEGCLVDTYGMAVIEGKLENSELIFNKDYVHATNIATAKYTIKYTYSLVGDGWQGLYSFMGFMGQEKNIGPTFCKIASVVDDAFGLMVGFPRQLW